MYLAGLFISLLIGVVLGLVGGGGSILTVPLVHYFFGESMLLATTYSLFVVAVASVLGVIQRINSGTNTIDFRKGIIFAIPSMTVAFVIRGFLMPILPSEFNLMNWTFSRDQLIVALLIVVMLYTAINTLLSKRESSAGKTHVIVIVFFGILTGLLSGFIGAGGGFIIVPILMRMGLDMKKAVGTSLLIICIQSSVALFGDFFNSEITEGEGVNWLLLGAITGVTVAGVFLGTFLQRFFSGKHLRKIFSFLLIAVALGMLWKF